MALHSTTRQVIQERMTRGRDIIVMSSCWGSGSGKWSFNPSQSFNLARFWKSLGFDVGCGLIDKNGSLCFLYTIRNPWHPELCSLGDVCFLLVFFFPPPPPSTKWVNYVHRSTSATTQRSPLSGLSGRVSASWLIFSGIFIPFEWQVCRRSWNIFRALVQIWYSIFLFMIQIMIWRYIDASIDIWALLLVGHN